MLEWLKEEWRPLVFILLIAVAAGIPAGAIGAYVPTYWFKTGVCE